MKISIWGSVINRKEWDKRGTLWKFNEWEKEYSDENFNLDSLFKFSWLLLSFKPLELI